MKRYLVVACQANDDDVVAPLSVISSRDLAPSGEALSLCDCVDNVSLNALWLNLS